jgi:indolepyruvate ferredoxin oxidoreductase beta subunit
MPAALGARILKSRWMRSLANRFAGKGKILKTTSLTGFLQLYWVASLRPSRRKTLRFKREIEQIDQWLAHVKELAPVNYDLACEVAECPRLVKGYGETHERGSRNFELLMQALPALRQQKNAASQLKSLREAALADDTGEKLAAALRQLGLQQGARA